MLAPSESDGVYSATMTQGTGKYKDYVGVKLTGGFIGQTSSGKGHLSYETSIIRLRLPVKDQLNL